MLDVPEVELAVNTCSLVIGEELIEDQMSFLKTHEFGEKTLFEQWEEEGKPVGPMTFFYVVYKRNGKEYPSLEDAVGVGHLREDFRRLRRSQD